VDRSERAFRTSWSKSLLPGKLRPHSHRLQKACWTHVFQEDRACLPNELVAVISPDEEKIRMSVRLKNSANLLHRGAQVGHPVERKNAEQTVYRLRLQWDLFETPIQNTDIRATSDLPQCTLAHIFSRLDSDELNVRPGAACQLQECSPCTTTCIDYNLIVVLDEQGTLNSVSGAAPARLQVQFVVILFRQQRVGLHNWVQHVHIHP
jgi:hypothetical protein